jgi:hypothetical protein
MTAMLKGTSALYATLSAALVLPISFWVFRWGLIRIWEWQHIGRRIVFVFGQEIEAAIAAVLLSICVFVFVRRLLVVGKPRSGQ